MDADTLERMLQQKLETSVQKVQSLQRQLDEANFELQENLHHYKEFQMKRYEEIQTNRLKTIRTIETLQQLWGTDKEPERQKQSGQDSEVEICTQVRSEVAATIGFVEIAAIDLMPLRSHNLSETGERLDDQRSENIEPEHRDSDPNDESLSSEQRNVDDCDAEQVDQLEGKSFAMPVVQPGLDSEQSMEVENDHHFQMDISTQVHSKDAAVDIVGENNLMSLRCHDVADTEERLDDERRKDMPEHRDSDTNDEILSSDQRNVDDCDAGQVNQFIEKSVSCTNLALQPGIKSKKSTKRSNSQIRQNRQSENRSEVTLKRFACNFNSCGRTFRTNFELKRHKRIHSDDRPFQCDICKNFFRRKDQILVHMKIHSGEKPFGCEICHKSFRQRGALAVHKKIHTEEMPFQCDICHRLFRHKIGLLTHKKIHAEDKNHKPFVCDYCGEKHCYKRSLIKHILECYKKSPGAPAAWLLRK